MQSSSSLALCASLPSLIFSRVAHARSDTTCMHICMQSLPDARGFLGQVLTLAQACSVSAHACSALAMLTLNPYGNNFSDYRKLKSFQKINHFPGVRELGNKRKLQRNMRNAVKKYGFGVFDVYILFLQLVCSVVAHLAPAIAFNCTESLKGY